MKKLIFFLLLSATVCTSTLFSETLIDLRGKSLEVEVGGVIPLSCRVSDGKSGFPVFSWESGRGEIVATDVAGEVDYRAPGTAGPDKVTVTVKINGKEEKRVLDLTVLPAGALKKTADILITVDTGTLSGVWVNPSHTSEAFKAPLSIKGTFRYDPDSELAFAGGSWPTYPMYDDGTHGDVTAGDGIWSILMKFEKTDSKVYFAFDDANTYRVEYESGLAWSLKMAWIDLDEFPDDHSNPAFVPDKDKTVSWTAAMAEKGGIHNER